MVTRSSAPLLVVAAALVFGGAVVLGFTALTDVVVRVLVALAVVAVGAGIALLPGVTPVGRAAGTGLVAFGAVLVGGVWPASDLVRFGLPALVLLGLVATGARIWAAGAGVLLVLAVTLPGGALVALAALLTVVVVFAPARAWWGDLAGAAAGMAVVTSGSVVAALVAAVLLMLAVARRDLVTGLLAATVLVVPAPGHAVPLAAIVVVALVAIRVPRVRDAVCRVPTALRDARPAHATAGAAVVAAGGLVGIALQLQSGVLTLVVLVLAGALGHWLTVPAGPALAVVVLVGLGLARPWADLVDVPALDLVTAVAAWPLLRRHPAPPVFAAAAYLVLRVLPPVLGPDPVPAHLVPILVVGGVAALFALRPRTAPAGQAVGAVVLGVVASGPVAGAWGPNLLTHRETVVVLALVLALGVSTGWRASAPLAVTAAAALYGTMALAGRLVATDGVVVVALVIAACALVTAAAFTRRRHASGAGLVHRP